MVSLGYNNCGLYLTIIQKILFPSPIEDCKIYTRKFPHPPPSFDEPHITSLHVYCTVLRFQCQVPEDLHQTPVVEREQYGVENCTLSVFSTYQPLITASPSAKHPTMIASQVSHPKLWLTTLTKHSKVSSALKVPSPSYASCPENRLCQCILDNVPDNQPFLLEALSNWRSVNSTKISYSPSLIVDIFSDPQ